MCLNTKVQQPTKKLLITIKVDKKYCILGAILQPGEPYNGASKSSQTNQALLLQKLSLAKCVDK